MSSLFRARHLGLSIFPTGRHRAGHVQPTAEEPSEARVFEWYYGPTVWDREPSHMWHYDCPDKVGDGHHGEVWYWKDGSATCNGCGAQQPAPEEEGEADDGA